MDFYGLITDDEKNTLDKILSQKGDFEIEGSFKKTSYSLYQKVIDYITDTYPENQISFTERLDIALREKDIVRWTIAEEHIEEFINDHRSDNFAKLLNYLQNSKYPVITKEIDSNNFLSIPDLNLSFKAAKESKGASRFSGGKLSFRLKSVIYVNTGEYEIQLSEVKTSPLLKAVSNANPDYEIEVERTKGKGTVILDPIYKLLQVIQKTKQPMRLSDQKNVLEKYYSLVNSKGLIKRQAINLEITHLIQFVPNNYGATDKADGERHQAIAFGGNLYLIDMTNAIKILPIKIDKKEEFIVDGELVDIGKHQFYGIFDVIYHNGKSYVNENGFKKRYKKVLEICKFFGDNFKYHIDRNPKEYSLESIEEIYLKTISEYWKEFKTDLRKTDLLIRPKLFFFTEGISPSEVFMLCKIIWSEYHQKGVAPYKLDGIILTPQELPYLINPHPRDYDQVPMEYKWKPANETSIDFYIEFIKDDNGIPINFIDSNNQKPYHTVKLMVGDTRAKKEIPIPFEIDKVPQTADFYLQDGEIRDINGNVVEDKTVVEAVLEPTNSQREKSWTILRTRYDKTEQVHKFGTTYGNNNNVAARVWRSINNPITKDDLYQLANPDIYQQTIESLENRLQHPESYYSQVTSLAEPMRAFHNWIKSCLIYTYSNGADKVLDLACGRGGDLGKLLKSSPKLYVGVDQDFTSLFTLDDSATKRYNNIKKKKGEGVFIHADVSIPLYVETQKKANQVITEESLKNIDKYLSGKIKYDFINCQFAVHYFFRDENTLAGFLKNINNHLNIGGHLVLTCFDGYLVEQILKDKDTHTGYYFDDNGSKLKLFEITKKYSDESDRLGRAIEVHNATIGKTHVTEYMVYPDDLIRAITSLPGLELVETDTFSSFFRTHQELFMQLGLTTVPDVPYLPGGKGFNKIRDFYRSVFDNMEKANDNIMGKVSYQFSMLNRFYVFKRVSKGGSAKPDIGIGFLEIRDCFRHIKSSISNKRPNVILSGENTLEKKIGNGDEHVLIIEKNGEYHPVSYGGNYEMTEDQAHILIESIKK